MNELAEKTKKLSDKMDKLTAKLLDTCDTADEMQDAGTELEETVAQAKDDLSDIVDLTKMMQDFTYIRATLKENSDNGRKIAGLLTELILNQDYELDNDMVAVFSELNRSITDTMKLFIQAYKEISAIIINIEKIRSKQLVPQNNTVNIEAGAVKSTAELLKELRDNH